MQQTAQSDRMNSSVESWDEFVAWDVDEFYDPLFGNDLSLQGSQGEGFSPNYHLSESVISEQPYLVSAPPSVIDGTPSLDFTVSAPPSNFGNSSSYGQIYCSSPSFDTNTTSPLLGIGEAQYFGSFDACDSRLSPTINRQESPIIDTQYERILGSSNGSLETTTETVFNPHVAGSLHSFSGLDVRATQILNAGSWMVEQPQIIEPIPEADEQYAVAVPIAIPQNQSQTFSHSIGPYPHSETHEHLIRSRAVTIPQGSRRPASYNPRVPPILSGSPTSYRRPRNNLSRSNSRNEGRRKMHTPSPTTPENFGWISYNMNSQTNRLAPTSTEGPQGRVLRGRKKGLTAEQRSHAALMRNVGACSNCKRRKEKCDPGTPCRSCLDHYKGDLVNHPCRDRVLSDLSTAILSDRLGWHPTARPIKTFVAPNTFDISRGIVYTIPLQWGFGPELMIPVNAVHIEDEQTQFHEHIIYDWPPGSSQGARHTHIVLPAMLTDEAVSSLMQTLDKHLTDLVMHNFNMFPLYKSPLQILREVYIFFRNLHHQSPHKRTLLQALKLLVLVHIGGDITLPPPQSNTNLSQLMRDTMAIASDDAPTPCFIRSQFGSVMPGLALAYLKQVLTSLERLLLNRDSEDWPITLALLLTVLMTVESVHYHAAKTPYHHSFDTTPVSNMEEDLRLSDDLVSTLLDYYKACFIGCHSRLRPDWEGEPVSAHQVGASSSDVFIEGLRTAMKNASSAGGYLSRKAVERREGDDMGHFFDRLVGSLLLLKG